MQVEPIFEKYLYAPVTWIALIVSRILRVIQTGYIHTYHTYLLYILITLAIALIYVGSGNRLSTYLK